MNAPAIQPRSVQRQFPHNRDIEASILGGVIIDNAILADLADVETDDFFVPQHRVVWEAMRNLQAGGRPIDIVTLENEIEKTGKLDAIGGVGFLGELACKVPTVENVRAYRDIALHLSKNRRTIVELGSALERAYNWPHDPSELVSEIVGQLARFTEADRDAETNRKARWCTDLGVFLGDAEPDDDDAIDWIIRDIVPRNEAALWGGPMKAGKTWSAMDLMIAIALGEDWLGQFQNTLGEPAPAVGILLEDNERRVGKRLWELCRARNITPHDSRIRRNLHISRAPLLLPDAKDMRRLIAELKQTRPAIVVIDNLTRVLVGDPNSTRDAAAFARAWTTICGEAETCVMFLHHTRKAGSNDQRGEVDPFETLRGSSDFGACARNIIVTTPIRTETELLAEVRMRGNLDLRRNGFVMGFERTQLLDRWRAKLTDRGEIDSVKQDVRAERKAAKEREKRAEALAETKRRRDLALHLAKTKGHVSGVMFASQLGLSSPRGKPAELLATLAAEGLLRPDRERGYVLADASAQENLPPMVAAALADCAQPAPEIGAPA
jgi:RecA-family ATPase